MVPEFLLEFPDLISLFCLSWDAEHASYLKLCRRHTSAVRISERAAGGNEALQIPGYVEYIIGDARIVCLRLSTIQSLEVLDSPMGDGNGLCNRFQLVRRSLYLFQDGVYVPEQRLDGDSGGQLVHHE